MVSFLIYGVLLSYGSVNIELPIGDFFKRITLPIFNIDIDYVLIETFWIIILLTTLAQKPYSHFLKTQFSLEAWWNAYGGHSLRTVTYHVLLLQHGSVMYVSILGNVHWPANMENRATVSLYWLLQSWQLRTINTACYGTLSQWTHDSYNGVL